MKYKSGHYIQLDRKIFDEEYYSLSIGAKWLYVYLSELEHRFCNEKNDFFFRTDEQLADDIHVSLKTVKKYKKELKEAGLIKVRYGRYRNSKTGKLSEEKYTAYVIPGDAEA